MTNAHSPAHAHCHDCGTTDVEWRQSKAGKWYLADLRYGARGSVYSDGPHFRSCTARGPKADHLRAIADRNAVLAARDAELRELFNAGDVEGVQAAYARHQAEDANV